MTDGTKKQAYWIEQQQLWETSGISQRMYCQREGLSFATFDYWRRRARERSVSAPQEAPLTLVPVRVASGASHVPDTPALHPMTLQSPSGWQLHFSAPAELAALLPLLRQLS